MVKPNPKRKPKRAAKAPRARADKPKKQKKQRAGRTRTRKREVYLSDAEDAIFSEMLKRQGCQTASELVRTWLERAEAQWRRRHKKPDDAPEPAADPRQMTLEQKLSSLASQQTAAAAAS